MSFTLNFQRIFVVLLAFFTLGQSHMIMRTPKPFGSPDSSPLDPSGSNFPCKGGSGYDFSNPTVMPIGSSQTLSFTGSAVHGGGSCQVALTTDLAPTASTKWMVIKSIEGGCPASIAGNFPADPEGTSASTFQVQIPDLPTGKYVWAWSWLNKVGNREFYMNCAPVEITAGQQKRYAPLGAVLAPRADSYPDLFVANIASKNKCVTKEGFDYLYPAPGPNVQKIGEGPFDH
ncbi:uncharacterized protein AB675_2992 [Cyphellophora attinorum]|uniref:Endoglucanase n=1 Tax=Cyphellophora attinorum TaxID=1664694 RepID=A0A0N1NW87_9EURO|nr:uncharacterized protein AB675_2992 [Phialophora attinorum]KPI36380.1 hypothetical protein AB675_2992 [Phialophora attinorum]